MAGHSKWANIQHRKGRQDEKRGKVWTRVIREIMVSARAGGGDLSANPRLRLAVEKAKAANMPADTVKRNIDKATGALAGVQFDEIRYEGYGAPAGRNRFEVLHKDAESSVAYFDERDAISVDADRARHVLVLNLNQSLRMDVASTCSLEEFLRLRAGAKVISMRVSTGAVSVDHTTVKGRIVTLPSLQSVVDILQATRLAWHTRFVHGFDEGFLIPDGGEPCGLLIAYLASLSDAPKPFPAP